MNTIISVSASLQAAGIAALLKSKPAPVVAPDGRMCVLVGDLFLHGTREDFAALIDGLQNLLDKLEPAPACPNCGETTGKPVYHQGGTDLETGAKDEGEGCTECVPHFMHEDIL